MDVPSGWSQVLSSEMAEPYFKELESFVRSERESNTPIYPPAGLELLALERVPFAQVKVVILGQDPYHGAGQAIGLAFGVPNDAYPKPPSLRNIFKEVQTDLGISIDPGLSDLSGWADQGVLLLNTVLTVRAHSANSHRKRGWERFTDRIIALLDSRKEPVIFVLWGSPAQKKKSLIQSHHHIVLEAPHPSPLSSHRGFFGCRHFSRINAELVSRGEPSINWSKTSLS